MRAQRDACGYRYRLDNSTTNNAVLVWNGVLGKWLGVWTGWNGSYAEITRFLAVNKLVFGTPSGLVNQWKDTNSLTDDSTYQDNGSAYVTKVWTRSFVFQDFIANKSGYSSIIRFTSGNATLNINWVADLTSLRTWSANPTPSGSILGGSDTLGQTFTLASTTPIEKVRGLRGLASFNEAYVQIESDISNGIGWFFLRNVSIGAFINPLTGI